MPIAQLHTIPGKTAPIHRGTPRPGQEARPPGTAQVIAPPIHPNPDQCGLPTKAGGKCKARPTLTGRCAGHQRQYEAKFSE